MKLEIIKFSTQKLSIDKNKKFGYVKRDVEDSVDIKKKYGIPVLPIIESSKIEIIEEVVPTINNEEKLVTLSFDDGPSIFTKELLNILNKNNSNATFFILGSNIRGNENIIKEIYDNGNEIGIHGYSHRPFTDMSIEDIDVEIATTYNMLESVGVKPSNIVRPPFGKLNETIKEQVRSPFVLWNINPDDIRCSNKETLKNRIMSEIAPGSIIKLHDTSKMTLEALDELLPILIKQGYKFTTIEEMNKRYSNILVPGRVYAKIKDLVA